MDLFYLFTDQCVICVILGFWSLNYVANTITQRYLRVIPGCRWFSPLNFLSSVGIYVAGLWIHRLPLYFSELITNRLLHMDTNHARIYTV